MKLRVMIPSSNTLPDHHHHHDNNHHHHQDDLTHALIPSSSSLSPSEREEASLPSLSSVEAMLSMIKCNWGIGMIAMPLYLQKSGSFAGLIFFLLTMILTFESIKKMSRAAKSDNTKTYSDVVELRLGYSCKILSMICIAASTYGSAIAYVQFVADTLSDFDGINPIYSVPILALFVSFSCFFDRLDALAKFSGIGLLFSVSFGMMIVGRSFFKTSSQSISDFRAEFFDIRWDSFPSATGLAVFCNEGIVVMSVQVAKDMKRSQDFLYAAAISVTLFTFAYMSVAFSGSVQYYGKVKDEITQNLLNDLDIPGRILPNLYCIQVVLTFPIVLWMAYSQYEQLHCFAQQPRKTRIAVRILSVILVCIIAATLRGFGDILALTGSAANSISIYILPNLCYYVSVGKHASFFDRVCIVLFLLFGVATGILGTVQSAKDLIDRNT